MAFERTLQVGWEHLDAVGHMANTAYMVLAINVRFHYFASRGFSPAEFRRHGIGPVVRRDEIDYHRELRLHDNVRVDIRLGGLAEDASRFRIVNALWREDGELAARVTSHGGWLDLGARKLVAPPEALATALRELERTDDFEALRSSVRKAATSSG